MFIPVGTDRRLKHTPYVNRTLLILNVLVAIGLSVYLKAAIWSGEYEVRLIADDDIRQFMLLPWQPRLHQFFTYQFLHGSLEHLMFNMLFLWVFGNALEDRLGPVGYLAFYLAGGVFAGAGYALTEGSPTLGASGSIAAVSGAYLALFPLTRVTMVFWLFIIHTFSVPAMLLILFSFGQDLLFTLLERTGRPVGGVAYLAHLSGNVFGFVIGMALLYSRILAREPYDFLALMDRWRRRREMRSVTRKGGSPWQSPKKVKLDKPISETDQRLLQMREAISAAVTEADPGRALDTYERLLAEDDTQVLSRDLQMDLANHAMQQQRYGTAARAYELFLKRFASDPQAPHIMLMLGVVYGRYLGQTDKAIPQLRTAIPRLHDAQQKQMAEALLSELGGEPA